MERAVKDNIPHGTNGSLSIAISATGAPEPGRLYTIPARCGVAVQVGRGQLLSVVNTHGTQVCDFWAFSSVDLSEYLSMHHVHTALGSIFPKCGYACVQRAGTDADNRRGYLTRCA